MKRFTGYTKGEWIWSLLEEEREKRRKRVSNVMSVREVKRDREKY